MTGPAAVLIGTLGQVPVKLPEEYSFAVDEIRNGESRCVEYHLVIDKRLWFWDTFSWRKSKNNELSRAFRKDSSKHYCSPQRLGLDSTGTPWEKPSQLN